MKILITTEFYLPFQCGVTTAVLNERKCLESKGHEVRILTINEDNESRYEDGVYYIRSNFPQLYKDSYATIAFNDPFLKDIYEWRPDIVHSQCEFFTMVYAKKTARKLHIPLIHTCHTDFDSYGVHFTKSTRVWKWATSTFIPKILSKADFIICPTGKVYELLSRYDVKNPMKIIPVGLDLAHLEKVLEADERNRIRAEYGFSPDDVVLVSVCRLSEEKNVGESITHFRSLINDRPAVKLLIVGDGNQKEILEQMAADLGLSGCVRFAGNVAMSEVWKYYKAGDIYISSSMSEIQGLTYIEALACSLPIVCRRDSALDMSLIPGVNGFDFTTDEEFKAALIPLIDDEEMRTGMGKAALKSVDKYSLENFASNLLEVFSRAAREKQQTV